MDIPSAASPGRGRNFPFYAGLAGIAGIYMLLIIGMLVADARFSSLAEIKRALVDENIRFSIKLTLITCFISAILSVLVAIPVGYLFSRFDFPFKRVFDTVLDIPIVLPPLVIGLSLLILFNQMQVWEFLILILLFLLFCLACRLDGVTQKCLLASLLPLALLAFWGLNQLEIGGVWAKNLEHIGSKIFRNGITYQVPAVILAQFTVACAFAVRTLRHTFDEISPRHEQVAQTLGCTQGQAFWYVVLPEAWRGVITAGSLAWARSLGEFGPILVFAAATRKKTEVLSTTVFLEISVGNLEGAVAVSLLMVFCAMAVLLLIRLLDPGKRV